MNRRRITDNIQKVKEKKKVKIDANQSTLNISKDNDYIDELIVSKLIDMGYKEPITKTEEQVLDEKIHSEYHREEIIVEVDVDNLPHEHMLDDVHNERRTEDIDRGDIEVREIKVNLEIDKALPKPFNPHITKEKEEQRLNREGIGIEDIEVTELRVQPIPEPTLSGVGTISSQDSEGVREFKMEKRRDILCQDEEVELNDTEQEYSINEGVDEVLGNHEYDSMEDELEEELGMIMQRFNEQEPIEQEPIEEEEEHEGVKEGRGNKIIIEESVAPKQVTLDDAFDIEEILDNEEIQTDNVKTNIIDENFLDELEKDLAEFEFGDLSEYVDEKSEEIEKEMIEDEVIEDKDEVVDDKDDFMNDLINEIKQEQDNVVKDVSFVEVDEEVVEDIEPEEKEEVIVEEEVKPIMSQPTKSKSKRDMSPEELLEALMSEAEDDLPQEIDVDSYANQVNGMLERLRQIPMENKSREVLEKRITSPNNADLDDIDKIIDILETNPDMREILDGDDYIGLQ